MTRVVNLYVCAIHYTNVCIIVIKKILLPRKKIGKMRKFLLILWETNLEKEKWKNKEIFIFGFCRYSIFGQNVEFFVYFSNFLLVSWLTTFVAFAQRCFTLVYNKAKITFVWKELLGCGKVSGKSAKLQQIHARFPLFHAFGVWKSGKCPSILLKCRKCGV